MTLPLLRTRPTLSLAGVLCAGVLALSACGGSNAYVGDDGEELALGETAEVEVDEEFSGRLDVTLDSIEEGDTADTEAMSDTNLRGQTPYYLRFTLTNPDGDSFAGAQFGGADMGLVNGLDTEGSALGSTVGIPDYEPCPSTELPADFDESGATAEMCVAVLTDGAEIVGANYIPASIESTTVWLP